MRFRLVALAFLGALTACNRVQQDTCMDSGGCWDSVDLVCRKIELNAQALCDRGKAK